MNGDRTATWFRFRCLDPRGIALAQVAGRESYAAA